MLPLQMLLKTVTQSMYGFSDDDETLYLQFRIIRAFFQKRNHFIQVDQVVGFEWI
jgi:hypothetical protein